MFKDAAAAKPFTESTQKKKNILIDNINKFLLD